MRRKSAKPKSTQDTWSENGLNYVRFTRKYGCVSTYNVKGYKYIQ